MRRPVPSTASLASTAPTIEARQTPRPRRQVDLLARTLGAATFILLAGACAQIAGLEDPDATQNPTTPGGGQTNLGAITISPSTLALGDVACGGTTTKALSLANNSDESATFEARLPEDTPFFFKDEGADASAGPRTITGTIAPHDQRFLYVGAAGGIPQPHKAEIVIKAGTAITQVPVEATVKGGNLEISPATIDFGEVRQQTPSPAIAVTLKNGGNERIAITGFGDTGAEFVLPNGTVTLEPDEEKTVDALFKPGPAGDPLSTTVTPVTEKPTCTTTPTITLKGRRVNQDVLLSPLSGDFGDWFCKETPDNPRTFTVTNYSTTEPTTFELRLTAGAASWYTLNGPAVDSVPVAASASQPSTKTFTIGAKAVASQLGDHTEDLEVKITAPAASAGTRLIPIKLKAQGAILQVTPLNLNNFAPGEEKAFAIKNVGNYLVYVRYAISGVGFSVTDSANDDFLDPGANNDIKVRFDAASAGTYNATVDISRQGVIFLKTAPLCEPPPAPTLTATR